MDAVIELILKIVPILSPFIDGLSPLVLPTKASPCGSTIVLLLHVSLKWGSGADMTYVLLANEARIDLEATSSHGGPHRLRRSLRLGQGRVGQMFVVVNCEVGLGQWHRMRAYRRCRGAARDCFAGAVARAATSSAGPTCMSGDFPSHIQHLGGQASNK